MASLENSLIILGVDVVSFCIFKLFIFMGVGVLSAHVSVHTVYDVPPEARRGHLDFPGLELQRVMSLGMECWESNSGSLDAQIVSVTAELFPQPMVLFSSTLCQ